ncbi:MerR family transcriptional regulator [Neobacillus niacini]|uniref:MerR family transcriptional regulator n=1 Tax=Neobacillus niacini TaxID=86668 RepID=UPI0021CAF811|nr:MerR family transcriptional regulator [Neobacillus niacini]MCM3767815.1 MerR family transcriptional regulator [Neobacillus niacini]
MKSYTLKEAAKKINIAPGIIRQWEKDLTGLLEIPRSKQGARIYSDLEINQLCEIKELYSNKASKEMIREFLQNKLTPPESTTEIEKEDVKTSEEPPVSQTSVTDVSLEIVDEPISQVSTNGNTLPGASQFFEAMDTYKMTFLHEVKEEIRSVVRKEVIDEVKKEISKGTLLTVKSLSDSIYKSSANTKAELEEITDTLKQATVDTNDKLRYLANNIKNVSIETADEIYSLTKQLNENSTKLTSYIDNTNTEISQLSESIIKEREFFIEEREEYRHDVRQREAAFRDMLSNFREAAATKDKKWWKFWN